MAVVILGTAMSDTKGKGSYYGKRIIIYYACSLCD